MPSQKLLDQQVDECIRCIQEASNIVALTGAGISTNAGIPDFRGPQGLYVTRQYDPDKVFDIGYFHEDPDLFFTFAKDFLELEKKIQPTATHHFFTKLEQSGKCQGIITQNIDALHQMAGAKNVLEMHGSFWQSYCVKCAKAYAYTQAKEKILKDKIPRCACGGVIKPDIVFFGEDVKHFSESAQLVAQSDLFFIIGTSCVVYPAAMLPDYAMGKIVVVNMDDIQIKANNIVLTVKEDLDKFFTKVSQALNL